MSLRELTEESPNLFLWGSPGQGPTSLVASHRPPEAASCALSRCKRPFTGHQECLLTVASEAVSRFRLEEVRLAVKLHRCSVMWAKMNGHPCWKVQKALDEAGVDYEVVKGPLRRGRRTEVERVSGQTKFPAIEFEDVVAFLCSERASYVCGVNMTVDGGLTRGI